jgi:uncharacterized membrane protein YeiH
MIATVVRLPVWIELPAVIAGALAGALFAQKRGLDLIGILALGLVTGLGGGILRDVLLGRVPLALRDPWYLWSVAGAALIGAFFAQAVNRMKLALNLIDAVSLGLFSVIGAQGGLTARLPIPSATLLGTMTGIGGSVLRDVLVGETPPRMLRRGPPYASAAILGAALYVGLVAGLDANKFVAEMAAVLVVLLIRAIATWRGWESPGPRDITPPRLRGRDDSGQPPPTDVPSRTTARPSERPEDVEEGRMG